MSKLSSVLIYDFLIQTVKEIVRQYPAEKLMSIYKITKFSDVDGFLATVRGKANKGVLDNTAAARTVLHDWNEGMPRTLDILFLYYAEGFVEC